MILCTFSYVYTIFMTNLYILYQMIWNSWLLLWMIIYLACTLYFKATFKDPDNILGYWQGTLYYNIAAAVAWWNPVMRTQLLSFTNSGLSSQLTGYPRPATQWRSAPSPAYGSHGISHWTNLQSWHGDIHLTEDRQTCAVQTGSNKVKYR